MGCKNITDVQHKCECKEKRERKRNIYLYKV